MRGRVGGRAGVVARGAGAAGVPGADDGAYFEDATGGGERGRGERTSKGQTRSARGGSTKVNKYSRGGERHG